jgi:cupin fold WbuC family metalloprotein
MIRALNRGLVDELIKKAHASPRKRAHHNFHQPEDRVQRMVNVLTRGTYVRPHKHVDPDKVEHFIVIQGKAACINHTDEGEIDSIWMISPEGPNYSVDILPNTYHTFVCVEEPAVMIEIVEGPYDPVTHKKFAPFAPAEDEPEAPAYLHAMEAAIAAAEKRSQ